MAAAADAAFDPALESLLAFWADAGVADAFADSAVDRFAAPPARARPEPPPRMEASAAPASLPAPAAAGAAVAEEVARARTAAATAQDWAQLQAAIAGFETPLRPRAGAPVIARGAERPALLVVGEGPSPEDEAAGAPFSGRVGVLLDRMLAAAGVAEQALLLPTTFWRAGDRAAGLALEQVCAPFLGRAVELLQPRALLLMGEAATRSLLGARAPILQTRGRWVEWTLEDGEGSPIPALPIFHPAFLLQHPTAKKRTWGDLLSLAERLGQA